MQSRIRIEDTVLLVVDVINSCCHQRCEIKKWGISFSKIREMVPRLNSFIAKYKKAGGQVVFVSCVPWDKKHLAKNIIELYKDPDCCYYSSDKTGFPEEFFGVVPDKNDLIITKSSYDAFTNPNLDKFLNRKKVKYVLVTGIFGDACVHSTIQGGFSKGYNFIMLKDLIETTDVKIRQELLRLLKEFTWPKMFGKTINSDEFFKRTRQL